MKDSTMKTLTPFESALKEVEKTRGEENGKREKTDIRIHDDAHLLQILERIVSPVGSRIEESSPMVDARLPDGSRVNAIIPPLALDGPILSIRRFGTDPLRMKDLIQLNAV